MNYGIVLKEKEFIEGLTKTDVMGLLDNEDELYTFLVFTRYT